MALNRDQVELIFRLSAESSSAEEVFEKFKQKVGRESKATAAIVRESFETLSSEIIESFGVDGDIANTLAQQLFGLRTSTLLLVAGLAAVPIAAVAAAGGLFAAAKSTADLAEEIDRVSQKTNLSVEALSALRLVAEENGSSLDQVSSALENLNQKFSDAQRGTRQAQEVFRAVGVDLKGPVDDALRTIIQRLNELPDGANKTAVATELFGEAGAALIPILNELDGDLDAQIEKLRELGLVFDKEAIAAAKRFGDQTDLLSRQLEGLKITIGNAVIPVFTGYIAILNQTFTAVRRLIQGTSDLTATLQKLFLLGLAGTNAGLLSSFAASLRTGEDKAEAPPKTGGAALPRTRGAGGGRRTREKPITEFDTEALRSLEKFAREELKKEVEANEAVERAEQQHRQRLEEIARLGEDRLIAAARDGAKNRLITEQQAQQLIAEIRISAIARQEDLLKEQIESARNLEDQLLERELLDKLRVLQEQRTNLEEQSVRDIESARQQDLENLRNYVEEQRRLREDLKNIERADPLSARSLIGDRFADVLAETGNVTTAIKASIDSVVGSLDSLRTNLEDIASGAITSFVQGLGSIVQNYVLMGETGPAALRKLLAATLATIAAESAVNAIVELAKGFAALFLNPPEAAAHFKAAALFGAAAAAAGVAGRAVAPSGGGAGAGVAGGAGGREVPRPIVQGDRGGGEARVILLRAEMQPGVVINLVADDYRDNGRMRQILRGDLVGETPT